MAESRTVICGGGVIGAAVAYELARRGERSVVVESDGVASGASGAAAGILTPPLPSDAEPADAPLQALRRSSFERHVELAATLPVDSGVDYGYRRTPRIQLATTPEEERSLRALATGSPRRVGTRWLDVDELRASADWVDGGAAARTRGGLLLEAPAQLDPYRFTLALLAAAERRGAELRSGRVSGLLRDGRRVAGLRIVGGQGAERELPADRVVVAMGPWSAEAAAWLGVPVPVEPLKGQIVKLRTHHELRPLVASLGSDYAVTKGPRELWLGTTEERAGFDREPTVGARDAILAMGARLSSFVSDAEFIEQTACLRPLSADGLPIVGAVPGLDGAYVATGHGRQGMLLAPASALGLVELMIRGATDVFDASALAPGRPAAG